MSEVKRYSAAKLKFPGEPGEYQVVPAHDYDALAQQLAVTDALCEDRFNEIAELRGQLAAEKVKTQTLMIELQDKNGALVDLREQLVASQARLSSLKEVKP